MAIQYSKLALLLAAAAGATTTTTRRRLGAKMDLKRLERDSVEGKLGRKLMFKLDADHKLVGKGRADKLATQVAKVVDCDDDAARVFRDAGKHEGEHAAFGLDMWYEVTCTSDPDPDAK